MIVTLDQRLFEAGALMLCVRFVLAAEGRHVLLTDPGWDPGDDGHPVRRSLASFSKEITDAVQETLDASLDEAANMGASVARIRVKPISASRWEEGLLSPADALRLMQTPLWLVLENGRNDLQFLRRILERKDRDALDEHLAEGRVEVPIGGGTGELKRFLENLATLPGTPSVVQETTSWIRRLRIWVMFDRDAHPDDPRLPSPTSETLLALCAGMTRPRPLPGHQLGWRTIENYLPVEALHAWVHSGTRHDTTRRRERLEAFMSSDFGEQRRACFPMKEGLIKDVDQAVRDEFAQRRVKQLKLRTRARWIHETKSPAARKRKPRTRERWLHEAELPAVFQGMQNTAFRDRLNPQVA